MAESRNPTWEREELILALDAYFQNGRQGLSKTSAAAVTLSEQIRALDIFPMELRNVDFRNAAGVSMKTYNLQALDPLHPGGLTRSGKRDQEVWDEFGEDAEAIARAAENVRTVGATLKTLEQRVVGDDDDRGGREGGLAYRLHLARERDPQVAERKKKSVLRKTGRLACEVCAFDFAATYGEHGKGFAECHHRVPLATLDTARITRLQDLAIVCSNCHRMIHRRPSSPMTLDDLRGVLAQAAALRLD